LSADSPLEYRVQIVQNAFDLRSGHGQSFALGDYPDRRYIERFTAPSYAEMKRDGLPNLQRASTRIQHGWASYEGMVLPIRDAKGKMQMSLSFSRLLALVEHIPTSGTKLSPRERQCLELLTAGKSAKIIAADLGLAQKSVENTVGRLKAKLNARNAAEAAAKAAFLLATGEIDGPPMGSIPRLSRREQQCLALVVAGRTWVEIADELTIAPGTVDKYIASLKRKFGARSIAELAARGLASFVRKG
jgi:DNA-binding CsgD family transcriptional regulator